MTPPIASDSNYKQQPNTTKQAQNLPTCIDSPKLHKTLQMLPTLPQPSLHCVPL
ncbi:hypothetical protein L873DRAFT_1823340 [Choiromyces venosus 120613-1]|uniref:Uncharacterized protein n=1 Tax=Choiromyces venosus 120613-1 TaxID=1336337 RepID=A0A3N4ITQ8_9PEZI|nr:hypothetical protein L873DRAFT_1823340 [Choiromyces venosus 120613-1]